MPPLLHVTQHDIELYNIVTNTQIYIKMDVGRLVPIMALKMTNQILIVRSKTVGEVGGEGEVEGEVDGEVPRWSTSLRLRTSRPKGVISQAG